MGVTILKSTPSDFLTPICNECGIHLCYDISIQEYNQDKNFWDDWRCDICNPHARGSYLEYRKNKNNVTHNS